MRISALLSTTLALLLLVSTGCEGSGTGTDGSPNGEGNGEEVPLTGLKSITLEPADQVLLVEAGQTPATVTYRATGFFEAYRRDVGRVEGEGRSQGFEEGC